MQLNKGGVLEFFAEVYQHVKTPKFWADVAKAAACAAAATVARQIVIHLMTEKSVAPE